MPARWKQAAWPSEKFVSYHNITRSEDGGSKVLRNVGILPQHYTVWRWRQHGPPKRRYPTTTLHDVTTQNSTWIWKLQVSHVYIHQHTKYLSLQNVISFKNHTDRHHLPVYSKVRNFTVHLNSFLQVLEQESRHHNYVFICLTHCMKCLFGGSIWWRLQKAERERENVWPTS